MSELTLESLARRLDEVERRLNEKQPSVIAPTRDWRSVVGISEETDFSRLMQAEMDAQRDAERQAAETEDGRENRPYGAEDGHGQSRAADYSQ
jgi:hypothetical protein